MTAQVYGVIARIINANHGQLLESFSVVATALNAGARGGDRTRIALRRRDFKSLASTSFATRARMFGTCRAQGPAARIVACAVRDPSRAERYPRPQKTRHRRVQAGACRVLRNGGQGRNRTGVRGFAGRCMTTLPPGRCAICFLKNKTPVNRGFAKLERETRLELATPTLARSCSTN
jgi:hypothetical protein